MSTTSDPAPSEAADETGNVNETGTSGNQPGLQTSKILRRFVGRQIWARPLPDFLILGAQKGGTTFLYRALLRHPLVALGRRKDKEEVHFFDLDFESGVDFYRCNFPRRLPKWLSILALRAPHVIGESSPYYLFHP